jgi:hypothetical protein
MADVASTVAGLDDSACLQACCRNMIRLSLVGRWVEERVA